MLACSTHVAEVHRMVIDDDEDSQDGDDEDFDNDDNDG